MKLSFEKIMKHIECLTIPIGTLALGLSLAGIDCVSLIALAGILCIVYIIYAIYLWTFRPKFDWHLIHGHFLRKVIAFVLLVPSFITLGFLTFNSIRACKAHNIEFGCDSTIIQKNKLPQTIISKQEDPSIFWAVYYHFIDPGNQHMTTSQSGRGWAALIGILGVFLLNGLLVSSIIGWIDRRKEKWQNGSIRYPFRCLGKNKYAVVIGANEIAASVIQNLSLPNLQHQGDHMNIC